MLERRAGGVGLSAAAAESGVQGWRAPVEGAAGWSRGGRRRGRGPGARGREERKEREKREGEKEKKKKMGKRKEKEKGKGGKRNKERKRGGGASASALIAAAVGHAWCRPRATRRPRAKQGWDNGKFGCRLGSSGHREVRREMNQERDRAQRRNKNLAHDLF